MRSTYSTVGAVLFKKRDPREDTFGPFFRAAFIAHVHCFPKQYRPGFSSFGADGPIAGYSVRHPIAYLPTHGGVWDAPH